MSSRYVLVILIMMCGFVLFSLTAAGSEVEPKYSIEMEGTRPTPILQPTPETPTPGGFIELHVAPIKTSYWTVVQWQGTGDKWHDVDGWRGTLDEAGIVRWYVGPEHLGEGPFRWLIYDEMDGELLATSESFNLPAQARQTVVVTVDLDAPAE